MPTITKAFFVRLTSRFVNIIEIALVSLVTRVTSLPTGISLSCSWERDSIWAVSYTHLPLIGNYGVNPKDFESKGIHMSAYITREWCPCPSNFRCQMDLDAFLKQQNVPGIYDLDTRYLTKLIRERGVMNGRLTSLRPDSAAVEDLKGWAITDAVAHVTCREPYQIPSPLPRHHVVLWDFGAKQNIIRKLHALNCDLTIVPASTTAARILSYSCPVSYTHLDVYKRQS